MVSVCIRNNVKIFGAGSRILMFGHGFGCDQNTWKHIVPAFEKDYRIVVFDYVGAGSSDLGSYSEERYGSLDGYALDVLEICEALNVQQVTFIGHSVSSMIGLLAANMQPERFMSMIFIGPSPRYINDDGYHGGIDRKDLEDLLELMDSNYLGWSQMIAPKIMGNPDQFHLGAELADSFCRTNPSIAKKFARVTFLSDNREDLSSLSVPSLTIQCRDDFLTSEKVSEYIRERVPNNKVVLLDSSGHCPHLSDPEAVVGAIKHFLI